MAKRIKIGAPVNDAEVWGFDLLERELPPEWLLITNVELPTSTGQLLEIDAIVFGDKAIYLVDIKGYSGQVLVDANIWLHDDRRIDNPLAKANQISRIYASRIRENLAPGEYSPWCQGMVFLTGQRGGALSLRKSQDALSVFGPDQIIAGLTDERYVTSQYKHPLSGSQRERAIDVLGRLGRLPEGPDQIAGFNRIRKLEAKDGVEQWLATSNRSELRSDWILKEVDLTAGTEECQVAAESLKAEYIRYQQLSGVPGVAICAPLVSDGERLVLPIRQPVGERLSALKSDAIDREAALQALRTLVSAAEQFEQRGLGHVALSADRVFLGEGGLVTLLASGEHRGAESTARDVLAFFWGKIGVLVASAAISQWFNSAGDSSDFETLRFLIASELTGRTSVAREKTKIAAGELLLGRYRLESCLEEAGPVQTWKATHEAGRFGAVCTIVASATERWSAAQERLSRLLQSFHPNVERVFDIEYLPDDDLYLVNRAWVEGDSIAETDDPAVVEKALITSLQALAYLHSLDILHRRICPEHVLLHGEAPMLIALSALPRDELVDSMPGYVHESVAEEGWSPRADLWALVKTFLDTQSTALQSLNGGAAEQLAAFVADPDSVEIGSEYVSTFGLQPKELLTELPPKLASAWGISKGYMSFLVLDMLNDGQPRSRNQIVLNALRSRRIAGNKTNRSSMSATVSRLKSAGIAEDYGKKLRLTQNFMDAWHSIMK